MRRVAVILAVVMAVWAGACVLLPEGMSIRGPILNSMYGSGIEPPTPEIIEQRIRAAEGYRVSLWADQVPNARFMRFSPQGSLLVSQPRLGQILHVLGDHDGDGVSDGQQVLVGDLDRPHGLDFHDGHLYIGEGSAIARVPVRESGLDTIRTSGKVVRIADGIPQGGNHWTRTLRFGPDGRIYLHVGSSCNVCEEEDPRRATILRFEADGSGEMIFASGLRNSTGFDWQPGTGELFATDNGRDLMGDDIPPCELNRVVEGGFYGWPYANGNNEPDPDFGAGNESRIADAIAPAHAFRAHNAPLGMTFVRHPSAPPGYRGAALVALHGSWNRSELDGYKVVSLHWNEAGDIEERDFVTGFLVDGDVIGRPVDVIEGPTGAFYVSDDYGGAIYRVTAASGSGAAKGSPLSRSMKDPDLPMAIANPLAEYDAPTRSRLTTRGGVLFGQHDCGTCHLESEAAPGVAIKPLSEIGRRYNVESLMTFFLAPQPPMPIVDLPEADREALAVYLMSEFAQTEASGERVDLPPNPLPNPLPNNDGQ